MVYDGAAALESTMSTDYDVVVLDRDLPAVHGGDVLAGWKLPGRPADPRWLSDL